MSWVGNCKLISSFYYIVLHNWLENVDDNMIESLLKIIKCIMLLRKKKEINNQHSVRIRRTLFVYDSNLSEYSNTRVTMH